MDEWFCDDEDVGYSLDSFGGSLCSTSGDDVLGSASAGDWAWFESSDSDLLNSASLQSPEQIYQSAALMGCGREAFELGRSNNVINTQTLDDQGLFPYEHSQPSSSSLSKGSSPENSSSLLLLQQRKATSSYIPNTTTLMQAHSQHQGVRFPLVPERDDAAIMKAMMAVISSSNSSSCAASSPSVMSNPLPLAPKFEASKSSSGQKMIKKSILMRRSISTSSVKSEEQAEWSTHRSTSNQTHHIMSERRRREKLNGSFHSLRMLLPPGSKKDKASVLINARNYLNTLRTQITELEEKNRRLETHLCKEGTREGGTGSTGSVQVQIIKASEPTAAVQQINIRITVRVECDIIELVLHVLECLKALRVVSVAAVDAYTYSTQMHIFARANLKLQIKSCDWNEASLQEAMNNAMDIVTATPKSLMLTD